MRYNSHPNVPHPTTHNGAPAQRLTPYQQLKRCIMACMLWEDSFYVDGKTQADTISDLCAKVSPQEILALAQECSSKAQMRHVPLLLLVQFFRLKGTKSHDGLLVKQIVCDICATRPDQLTEFLSLYWKDGKKCIPRQMRLGMAMAFKCFDEYQLAKYNRDNPIKLRDVLFLVHPKANSDAQQEMWNRLAKNELRTPDTWETRLSSGADKKESFLELIEQNKLGALAALRNLRNMKEAGLTQEMAAKALNKPGRPLLPFQFIAAAKEVPEWEKIIDAAMLKSMRNMDKLPGRTIVFVDVSGSMAQPLSGKSKMTRFEAAAGLAILLDGVCERQTTFTFSQALAMIPPRSGMALRDAIAQSQPQSSTLLGLALQAFLTLKIDYERIIIITDEQINDVIPNMPGDKKYILNVGAYQNGIAHHGQFHVISGFSQASIDYIREIESDQNENESHEPMGAGMDRTKKKRTSRSIAPVSTETEDESAADTTWGY